MTPPDQQSPRQTWDIYVCEHGCVFPHHWHSCPHSPGSDGRYFDRHVTVSPLTSRLEVDEAMVGAVKRKAPHGVVFSTTEATVIARAVLSAALTPDTRESEDV